MMQTGYLFGGWQLARGALVAANLSASGERVVFCDRKVNTAQFYMERLLPRRAPMRVPLMRRVRVCLRSPMTGSESVVRSRRPIYRMPILRPASGLSVSRVWHSRTLRGLSPQ